MLRTWRGKRALIMLSHSRICRQVAAADIKRVLQHGSLNRKASRFGGRPSPVFVFDASFEVVEADGGQLDIDSPAAAAGPAAAGTVQAAAEEQEAAAVAAAQQQQQQQQRRQQRPTKQLRVPFAANADATVALTVIDPTL